MMRQNAEDVEPRCLLAGRVRQRGTTVLPLPTVMGKKSQTVVDPLRRLQPVQMTEECRDVLVR